MLTTEVSVEDQVWAHSPPLTPIELSMIKMVVSSPQLTQGLKVALDTSFVPNTGWVVSIWSDRQCELRHWFLGSGCALCSGSGIWRLALGLPDGVWQGQIQTCAKQLRSGIQGRRFPASHQRVRINEKQCWSVDFKLILQKLLLKLVSSTQKKSKLLFN